jgi:hypothetical protein
MGKRKTDEGWQTMDHSTRKVRRLLRSDSDSESDDD